ncbi:MAG: hypothetical protein UX04_C0002G0156 [Microgenomates group bacterium GW2011_GWF2_45_18]|nr:MAG: hypothetical protein UW18_C0005G0017 [Microgenomates group bacterium GW2011_GWF1_44_10]KKU02013.1 MAG: hypothetical protein UX04_C0002G0156 [Microgenomates group bacterium GW2011_GWF2_45_18]OGJ41198.1 MAG: hypothetical protein A2378_00955 [Candidatus Pacebacteria bacterium RIFOXYB1_FULL_44_10]HAU99001.1 hypothetical protein [Candidatus Paceibacterota bacterium]HAX01285.1 hypothetical protein [Candidatus Paceibacterota bacterium]
MTQQARASFHQKRVSALNNLHPDAISIFEKDFFDEIPLEYSIHFVLPDALRDSVQAYCRELQSIDSRMFFYPHSSLHMTLLGNIPHTNQVPDIIRAMQRLLTQREYCFTGFGIESDERGVDFICVPEFDLIGLRHTLRKEIGGTRYTNKFEEFEGLGWINFMRYLAKPKPELLERLQHDALFSLPRFCVSSTILVKTRTRTLREGLFSIEFESTM